MYGAENGWRQLPTIMKAVCDAGYFPGHLDGTPSNALEQRGNDPERIGVSVLKSKQKPRMIAQIVWNNDNLTENGSWTIVHKRVRRGTANRLFVKLWRRFEALGQQLGEDVVIGTVTTQEMPLYSS